MTGSKTGSTRKNAKRSRPISPIHLGDTDFSDPQPERAAPPQNLPAKKRRHLTRISDSRDRHQTKIEQFFPVAEKQGVDSLDAENI